MAEKAVERNYAKFQDQGFIRSKVKGKQKLGKRKQRKGQFCMQPCAEKCNGENLMLQLYKKYQLTIAPRPVSKHASSSHNTRLVGGGVAPRGWWHIAAKLLQCLQFPAWEQPLSPAWGRLRFPAWQHLPVPCLGTFAVPAWDACQFPAWERLPVCMPCLGMLVVPAWDACQFPAWERLPVPCLGTFASSLPGNVCQCPAWARCAVLPGTLCQFPAWERLPMP